MQQTPDLEYGGKKFRTLTALKKHIKEVVDFANRPPEQEFVSDVLSDVVLDRHYRWSHRGVRPTSFKFIMNSPDDGRIWPYSLAGFFPGWGWCRFSYNKCCRAKKPTMETEFNRLCRERFRGHWREQIMGHRWKCEKCPRRATDVDHVNPQHAEIVKACWDLLDEETTNTWWEIMIGEPTIDHFTLPEGHPVTELYDQATRDGEYQILCKKHHKEATKQRKKRTGQ